jgi:UDP-N-acetylglucosamine--N-acetylmuramyl-(pentapeptide) pyrophosphoryl-undecaprenol N-acetylglucosamine transferase
MDEAAQEKKKILLSAGGTGGHFFPCLATYDFFKFSDYKPIVVTDLRCKKYINPDSKIDYEIIDIKISSNNLLSKVMSILAIIKASTKAFVLIRKIKPKMIVGFGGYPTFPILLNAVLFNIPIVLHEQNSIIGKTNLFFLKFAKKIFISYSDTKGIPTCLSHKQILAKELVRLNISNIRKSYLGNKFEKFNILVFGGSQSAKIFSTLIPEAIKIVAKKAPNVKLKISQQSSREDYPILSKIYSEIGVEHQIQEFFLDMDKQYQKSDLVISRAGASSIAEFSSIGMPSILIPFPFASDNHQMHNAIAIEKIGGGWCFEQNSINADVLADKILDILNNPSILQNASENLVRRCQNSNIEFINGLLDMLEPKIKLQS